MYQLTVYIPETHLDQVKSALFEAGAGRYQHYDSCAWQTKGEGQFRPLKGSTPHLGQQDTIEKVSEYKVEMICEANNLKNLLAALKKTHPYEEPAYSYWPINPPL